MRSGNQLKEEIFTINVNTFEKFALEVFKYQWEQNPVYYKYCTFLKKDPDVVKTVNDIPFLPIAFYKTQEVKSGSWETEKKFLSSGTTASIRSVQHVLDECFYHRVCKEIFENSYGPINTLEIYALLPSYQEQGSSSLISMMDSFIQETAHGGFFLDNHSQLIKELERNTGRKKVLVGVSYALLDLAEKYPVKLKDVIVMETGGMKGRRKELTRAELHNLLRAAFGVDEIHSEYGMTELTSQAYAKNGKFSFPNWAGIRIRDINDPFCLVGPEKTGGINIIDFANIDTCAFIETQDLGKIDETGCFEVLGRYDDSDIRGCNLII